MSRTKEEITQEYGNTCAILGDRVFKSMALNNEISQIQQKLAELNKEANEVTAQPAVSEVKS